MWDKTYNIYLTESGLYSATQWSSVSSIFLWNYFLYGYHINSDSCKATSKVKMTLTCSFMFSYSQFLLYMPGRLSFCDNGFISGDSAGIHSDGITVWFCLLKKLQNMFFKAAALPSVYWSCCLPFVLTITFSC